MKHIKKKREKRKELREIIQSAREECRPLEESKSTYTNITAIQFNSMDDTELLQRKEELIKQITKGGFNGKRKPGIQADSPGGSGQGTSQVWREGKPAIDPEWIAETERAERVAGQQEA